MISNEFFHNFPTDLGPFIKLLHLEIVFIFAEETFFEIGDYTGACTEATESGLNKVIPAYPKFRDISGISNLSQDPDAGLECVEGTIAVALNGVAIYGPAVGANCALLDVEDCGGEWVSFDCCGGHGPGIYHYHFAPTCLINQAGTIASGHSAQIGWSFDGFPIYGPLSVNGIPVKRCGTAGADSDYCMDECGGIEFQDSRIDEFLYRYYMTGPIGDAITTPFAVRPDPVSDYPYSINCYRGLLQSEIEANAANAGNGYTSSYTASGHSGFTTEIPNTCDDLDVAYTCSDGVTPLHSQSGMS